MSDALQQLLKQAEAQRLQMEMQVLLAKNLKVFKQRFPNLYQLVKDYAPTRHVLHLDPNDKLNLVDKIERQYLYNSVPTDFCEQQVSQFSKKSQVKRFRITKNKEYNSDHLHIPHLNRLVDALQKETFERAKTTPNYISFLLISGIGLGYHLPKLIADFDIQNAVIYEGCLDTFYASLQTIDWTQVLDYFRQNNRSISIVVGTSPTALLRQVEYIINELGLHALTFTFVYQHTQRAPEKAVIEAFEKELQASMGGLGYFDDEQIGLAHAYHNLNSDTSIFVCNDPHQRKTPVLLVGNGPSLDYHRDYLASRQDSVVIMSCGTALGSLLKMGIKPDFHVEMERCVLVKDCIEYGATDEDRKNITLLCLHTVAPETIQTFSTSCIALKPNDAGGPLVHDYCKPKKINELVYCNPTVVNCGLSFAVSMGFENIHLIGVDFGMPDGSQHHSKYSIYKDMEKHGEKTDKEVKLFDESRALVCEGNFGGEVTSTPLLQLARITMERYIQLIKPAFPHLKIINTNNGAKINGTDTKELSAIHANTSNQRNKLDEIDSIKRSHFLNVDNQKFTEAYATSKLDHFFAVKDSLKMTETLTTERDAYMEMRRIYKIISRKNNPITNLLLRGSVNTFFGSIVENVFYCHDPKNFQRQLSIGIAHYNRFIEEVYKKIESNPFSLDETHSEFVQAMTKAKHAQETASTHG